MDRDRLFEAIRQAESLSRHLLGQLGTPIEGELVAFGPTREVKSAQDGFLSSYLDDNAMWHFDAYRADFMAKSENFLGEVSVWGNVAESDGRSVGEAGENIGVGLSAAYLAGCNDNDGFEFIRQVIKLTYWLHDDVVDGMFRAISTEITNRPLGVSGLTYPR